ncbi:FAD:protein FMN transferase [Emticicia sp. SJ17W-69]|uniref:FAD:protein FMN transferase n=1 Tax=Emticicia sp. SJ17W-69 TaxID=3421657 RepID=UPI003EBD2971
MKIFFSRMIDLRNSFLGLFLFLSLWASGQNRYEFTHPQMGTMFKIILYSTDSLSAIHASQKAFSRLDELNLILSDYREDSEINRLCRTSGTNEYIKVSNDLWEILQESTKAAKLSKGYFDVTIGPMTQLWRRMKRQKQLPSQQQIDEARAKIGIENISFNAKKQSIMLKKQGMRIDFGGIGKGFAEDKMIKVLQKNGIKSVLIEAGGNIVVGDSPTDSPNGWEIAIKDKKYFLKNCGISTSGDLYQFVEIEGKKYAHILDPKTGIGFTEPRQISVVAKDGTSSDWLSTALYLMKQKDGEKLIKKLKVRAF